MVVVSVCQKAARGSKGGVDLPTVALPKQTDLFEITKQKDVLSTEHSTVLLILVTWN